jgi:hypothetical protein
MEKEYTVTIACNFEADSPEDAVKQMAAWLDDYCYKAGYRVTDGKDKWFIDAERL